MGYYVMSAETLQAAYNRGVVDTRLDNHDEQIAATKDLLAKTVEISQMNASIVQTLSEARVTDARERLSTAAAVKEAKELTEAQAHEGWSPVAKLATAVGIMAIIWTILSSLPFSV